MKIHLTRRQKIIVDKLITQGWPRDAAELVVVESEEDVFECDTPPPHAKKSCPRPTIQN